MRSNPPTLFRLGKWMNKMHLRGGHRLLDLAERTGVLNDDVGYQLTDKLVFRVPIRRADNRWDLNDVVGYEQRLISAFVDELAPMSDVTLFDCGADIGTFSALVCCRSDRLARIVAFEPNLDVVSVLRSNLEAINLPYTLHSSAVGDKKGRGSLERPSYDDSDHGRFIRSSASGPIEIVTVDDQGVRGGDIAIKIDVEGTELAVLQGARETIAAARSCLVTVEAHPKVARRTGQDPVECLRFLQSIRPFRFLIAETGQRPDLKDRLITSEKTGIANVIASSID